VDPAAPVGELPPPDAAYYDEKDLDVVKVTVDRREKNIQNYAGSASAFSEEDLQRVGITSVRQLGHVAPYLEIGTQEGNTEVHIRGIGHLDNTELGDPAAASYVNDVYIPRPRGVGSMFFDIERVEINRGPQGTLRGRNAAAGSLNVIPNAPRLGEFAANGEFQFGNYSQRLMRAMVNVPVAPNLALRFAAFGENRDPFYKNAGPIQTITPSESADNLAYRASALWRPFDRVKVNLTHDYLQERGTGYTGTNFAPALQAGLLPNEVPDPRAVIFRGPQPAQRMMHWGVGGKFNVDLGPALIDLISSYRSMSYNQTTGGNAGVAFPGMQPPQLDNWSTSYWRTTSKSTVQELRIYAPDTARLRWTVGGFFFYEKQTGFLGSTADQSVGFAGVEFNMPDVRTNSQAGYFDAVYDILKNLRATAGFRFTREEKTRNGLAAIYLPDTGGMPFRFGTEGFRFAQDGRTIFDPANVPAGSPAGTVLTDGVTFGVRDNLGNLLIGDNSSYTPNHGHYTGRFFDWRAGIDHDLTPVNLLYLMASTGHHSGGFNDTINLPSGMAIAPTYKPETLYALEVGSKNMLLEKKLKVNAAAYGYLYRNQQFSSVQSLIDPGDPTQVGAPTLFRFNVAESHVLGLEVEASYKLPYGLVAAAQAMLLDARFDSGEIADSRLGFDITTQPIINLEGLRLPRAPRATVHYSLSQTFSTSIGHFDWIVTGRTRSQYFMTPFNGNGRDRMGNINPVLSDVQPAYTRFDAGVGYTRLDGKVRLELFGANLTNATYLASLINTPGLNLRFFNSPRQFGIRLQLFW
jgi:iron complex outermembrane receptor protein